MRGKSAPGLIAALIGALSALAFLTIIYLLSQSEFYRALWTYGWLVFLVAPAIQGVVIELTCQKLPVDGPILGYLWSLLSVAFLMIFLALFGIEGWGCIAMAAPPWIAITTGAVAITRVLSKGDSISRCVLFCVPVAFPIAVWHDTAAVPKEQRVVSELLIHAPPKTIWPLLQNLSGYHAPSEWLFRAGVAYPIGTTTFGPVRLCRMSTGDIVERFTAVEPLKRLAWRVVSMPDSMHETSPYGEIHPAHLQGVFVLHEGGFVLTPMADGSTKLVGFTTYTNAMAPETYWDLWCKAVVHDVHNRVMNQIKKNAEVSP